MVLWFILVLALEGLIVGALARLALPGPDPMGILATIGLGLAGSFGTPGIDLGGIGPFDLIVAISTLEHVGWDESPRDPAKAPRAVEVLRSLPGFEIPETPCPN